MEAPTMHGQSRSHTRTQPTWQGSHHQNQSKNSACWDSKTNLDCLEKDPNGSQWCQSIPEIGPAIVLPSLGGSMLLGQLFLWSPLASQHPVAFCTGPTRAGAWLRPEEVLLTSNVRRQIRLPRHTWATSSTWWTGGIFPWPKTKQLSEETLLSLMCGMNISVYCSSWLQNSTSCHTWSHSWVCSDFFYS